MVGKTGGLLLPERYHSPVLGAWERRESPWEGRGKPFLSFDGRWPRGTAQEYSNIVLNDEYQEKDIHTHISFTLRTLYVFEIISIFKPSIKK